MPPRSDWGGEGGKGCLGEDSTFGELGGEVSGVKVSSCDNITADLIVSSGETVFARSNSALSSWVDANRDDHSAEETGIEEELGWCSKSLFLLFSFDITSEGGVSGKHIRSIPDRKE